jgi:hypothetical protein
MAVCSRFAGTRYKPSLIADVFWKPFDSRFASLIERMRTHQEVFKSEMQLEESKYLESQSEKQARQSSLIGKALEQIQAQAAELRQYNIDLDSKLSSQLDSFIRKIHSNYRQSGRYESEEKGALRTYFVACDADLYLQFTQSQRQPRSRPGLPRQITCESTKSRAESTSPKLELIFLAISITWIGETRPSLVIC